MRSTAWRCLALSALLALAAADDGDVTCGQADEGNPVPLQCFGKGNGIVSVGFADYGAPGGGCPPTTDPLRPGPCGHNISSAVAAACVGKPNCTVVCTHGSLPGKQGCCPSSGTGGCCGCTVTAPGAPPTHLALPDPCPGQKKTLAVSVACADAPSGAGGGVTVVGLRVNAMTDPISIDEPNPRFTWALEATARGVVMSSFRVQLSRVDPSGGGGEKLEWDSGKVASNRSFFAAPKAVASATTYHWRVRVWVQGGAANGTAWSDAYFSTALLEQSDWDGAGAEWISPSDGTQMASQMRKEFLLPGGSDVVSARAFVALPGYGTVSVNGQRVDGEAGTRSLSQYDVRMLYSTYDIAPYLVPGKINCIAVYVGLGWWGHPAVPPQAKRFPFGPPTLRAHLVVDLGARGAMTVSTDDSWTQTEGPYTYDDNYNGVVYDGRLVTPRWDVPGYVPPNGTGAANWTPVALSKTQPSFALNNTVMSSAQFAPVRVVDHTAAVEMREPKPGVFVFDFGQNGPGWCRLKITGPAGLRVQLRHAEVLQHPPYGPEDGTIYVDNLRSAKATDVYILRGDPEGEVFEPTFTQHGFRYAELTGVVDPPTLESLEKVVIRTAVQESGDLTFGDDTLQHVHHNILYGQASNLMMVPTDCDQRDERFGWTGDSALTADEASLNFDLQAFYRNWLQMLDDSSQNGAVACWVPGGVGHSSPAANAGCDASWQSAYPSVAFALMKWYGDVEAPAKHWQGLTRWVDNEFGQAKGDVTKIKTGPGDWCPAPKVNDSDFVPEARVAPIISASFSAVRDLRNMVEMAQRTGNTADAKRFKTQLASALQAWHTAWWDPAAGHYGKGEQTAQVLALELDCMPTPEIKQKVISNLLGNIVQQHGNHSTSGIIGYRFVADVLSANGYGDVAYSLLTQTTYPSIGYEIKGGLGEPATTLWELWDSDHEGPSMNSRNHIMFGGPGKWLHTYVSGIDNTPGTNGFVDIVFAPPATLVERAMRPPAKAPGDTTSPPLTWSSATRAGTCGTMALYWSADAASGKLTIDVTAPPNTVGTTAVPLLGADPSAVTVTESGSPVWAKGAYVPGVDGVTGASATPDAIEVRHGSGTYSFGR